MIESFFRTFDPLGTRAVRKNAFVAGVLTSIAACRIAAAQTVNAQPSDAHRPKAQIAVRAAPDSAIAFTYTVRTNRTDSVAVGRWNSRVDVTMRNGEIRMDLLSGEPMLCCTESRVTNPQLYEYYPWRDNGTSSLFLLNDGRLVIAVAKKIDWSKPMSASRLSLGIRDFFDVKAGARDGASFVDLGDGPIIEGFRTRHVRVVQNYGFEMHWEQWRTRYASSDTSDLWISRDLHVDAASASLWAHTFGLSGYITAPTLRNDFEPFVRKFGCTGIPLRIVSRLHLKRESEQTETTRVDTIEVRVSDIRHAILDTTQFLSKYPTSQGVSASSASAIAEERRTWDKYKGPPPLEFTCSASAPRAN